jgi:hypothetical protein
MAALERETEISDQPLAAWRAGLPTLAGEWNERAAGKYVCVGMWSHAPRGCAT